MFVCVYMCVYMCVYICVYICVFVLPHVGGCLCDFMCVLCVCVFDLGSVLCGSMHSCLCVRVLASLRRYLCL